MARLGYVTLGTNDLEKAAAFYDELLGSIGHTRIFQDENGFIAWGVSLENPGVADAAQQLVVERGCFFQVIGTEGDVSESGHGATSKELERVMGIEPTSSAWEAEVLPLNYTRALANLAKDHG